MKNLKKLFAVIVAVAMLATFAIPAFAAVPSDVEGTECEDAVTRLVALGIVTGRPDGTYAPEENISRAEFAAIVVRALGAETAAGGARGQTKFTDVGADHWASGYINLANSMGIVNGRPDGTFAPNDNVTYEEAITMIVRALGYEPKASALGGYPNGYLTIAAEKEITDAVDVINGVAATRGDVALLVDASLDVPMMVQSTWGEYPEYEEDEDKTLLSKLGVDEIEEKMVTAVPKTDSSLEENEIEIDGDVYTVVGDFDVDSLLGLQVNAWAEDDEVFFIEVSTDEDDVKFDTVADVSADDVKLKVDDEEYDWADDATVWVNFEEKDPEDVNKGAYGYFVFDKDEVVAANLFEFDGIGVVTSIDDEEIVYRDATDATEDEVDLDAAEEVYVYNSDFTITDEEAIDEDSAIFFWEDSDDNLYIVVSNETVDGSLDRIRDAEVKIGGTVYDAAADAIYSDDDKESFDVYDEIADIDSLGGEEVVALLDLNGDVLFIYGNSEATSDTIYGLVTYGSLGSKAEVTVFNKDGEEVEYVFENRTDAVDIPVSGSVYKDIDELEYFGVDPNLEFAVMEFKLNKDGEIDDNNNTIDVIDMSDNTTFSGNLKKDADKAYVYVDGTTKYYISEDTIFIKALNSDGELDPSTISYDSIYESDIADTPVFVYGEASKDANMIVFLDKTFTGADDDKYYGVVTEDPWKEGDDYVVSIDVFGEGENEYIVDNEADWSNGLVVEFYFNSEDEIVRSGVGVDDTDSNFDYDDGYVLNTDDGTVKIASDAVVYALDDEGKVDEKVKSNDVDDSEYAELNYILDEDNILVAAVVSGDPTHDDGDKTADYKLGTFTKTGLTITGAVYDEDTAENNTYTVKVTNLDTNKVVYEQTTLSQGDNGVLTFTFGTALGDTGTYQIDLFRDNPNDVLATFEKFLYIISN